MFVCLQEKSMVWGWLNILNGVKSCMVWVIRRRAEYTFRNVETNTGLSEPTLKRGFNTIPASLLITVTSYFPMQSFSILLKDEQSYTVVRNVETKPALFRANTHSKRDSRHGCTPKKLFWILLIVSTSHHAKLQHSAEDTQSITVRNVVTAPALFRANTHSKRDSRHGCTHKLTVLFTSYCHTSHHAKLQQSPEDEQRILSETSRPNRLLSEPTLPKMRLNQGQNFIAQEAAKLPKITFYRIRLPDKIQCHIVHILTSILLISVEQKIV